MKTNKIFAGIGARETPKEILDKMYEIGQKLCGNGYTLRSGGAPGADQTWERSFLDYFSQRDIQHERIEIFLPWKNFENNPSTNYNPPEDAFKIVKPLHGTWDKLKQGGQKLMARNVQIILGKECDPSQKVDFVIGYAVKNQWGGYGGTGIAFDIAKKYKIPVYNLADGDLEISPTGEVSFYTLEKTNPNKIEITLEDSEDIPF